MTSELKCPFCQTELEQMHDKKMLGCPKCLHIADGAFWVKAIQAKQDLEKANAELERKLKIARKALDWLGNNRLAENPVRVEQLRRHARNALKQIEHKEQ